MWRTFFLSIGIALAIFGAEFLIVEKAVWDESADDSDVQKVAGLLTDDDEQESSPGEFKPEPWIPWAMISSGAIIILYTVSIPKD